MEQSQKIMKLLFTTTILFISLISDAQVTISGNVKSFKNKVLKGVTITLKNTYDGTVTDSAGNYNFTTTESGKFELEAKLADYTVVTIFVTISNTSIIQNFRLKEEISELRAVVVSAGSFAAGDKKRAATVLSTLDIYTTANANADITGAVKTLPGAQQIGEQEGLFVRGGAGYETKQFIDGSYVNNPFFSGAQDIATRGRFSPSLFKGTIFSTGGYSALYGQALSSALILESIDLPEQTQVDASASALFLGAGFQNLAKNKKSSYGLNASYTDLGLYFKLIKQTPYFFQVPQVFNSDANFRFKTKNGGMVKYYTTFATNKLGLRRPNIDDLNLKNSFDLNNLNWYNNMNWKESLGKGWKMQVALSYAYNQDDISQEIVNQNNIKTITGLSHIDGNNFSFLNKIHTSQARLVMDKRLSGISVLRFGGEHWYNNVSSLINNSFTSTLKDNLTAAFAEADLTITNSLAVKVGLRGEYSSIIDKFNLAPRVSFAYKTGKDAQMSIAYGDFYQKPENQWLQQTTNQLGYMKATHYQINYIKSNKDYTFRIEGFYKKYDNLVKSFPSYNNNGNGFAQGIELFWRDKKTVKNLDYWISYSYLDTKRDFLNYPSKIQPTFAANHTASLVAKRFVTSWKTGFNFTYSWATGRPFYFFQQNAGQMEIKDEGRTIPYNSLSFSLNYLPNLGKQNTKTFIVLVASVTNVLNQNQVFGYNYNYNGTFKQAINPPAPQFFFLGCFLSWGIDRTQDAINNNL